MSSLSRDTNPHSLHDTRQQSQTREARRGRPSLIFEDRLEAGNKVREQYGKKVEAARRAQYDFDSQKSVDENVEAVMQQYGQTTHHDPEQIRASVVSLFNTFDHIRKKEERAIGGDEAQREIERKRIKSSDIHETAIYFADILKWFGENARVTFTSSYDDKRKGVDCVIEWKVKVKRKDETGKEREQEEILRLGVDITLVRPGQSEDLTRKLEKKMKREAMDPEDYEKLLLDGAVRTLDFFKSQVVPKERQGFESVRNETLKTTYERPGVTVPAVVASMAPTDMYRFAADIAMVDDTRSGSDRVSLRDLEQEGEAARDEFKDHPLRIVFLKSVLKGIDQQIQSVEEQPKLYPNDARVQELVPKTAQYLKDIRALIVEQLTPLLSESERSTVVAFERPKEKQGMTEGEKEAKKISEAVEKNTQALEAFFKQFSHRFGVAPESVAVDKGDNEMLQSIRRLSEEKDAQALEKQLDAFEDTVLSGLLNQDIRTISSIPGSGSEGDPYNQNKKRIQEFFASQKDTIQDTRLFQRIREYERKDSIRERIASALAMVQEEAAKRVA